MDLAYHFSPAAARVIIPDTGPVAIASQGVPSPVDGPVEILADFAVSFAVDAVGTAATTVPISYPIAFGGIAGTFVSFDAEIDYSSTLAGFLGTSELHFAFAGPGGSPLLTVSGPDLMLPALLPGDTLTLTGFLLTVGRWVPWRFHGNRGVRRGRTRAVDGTIGGHRVRRPGGAAENPPPHPSVISSTASDAVPRTACRTLHCVPIRCAPRAPTANLDHGSLRGKHDETETAVRIARQLSI